MNERPNLMQRIVADALGSLLLLVLAISAGTPGVKR
jgi:hypothetical protein